MHAVAFRWAWILVERRRCSSLPQCEGWRLYSRDLATPVGVRAATGMVRDVWRSSSANPGYRSACTAYLSSRSAPCSTVACTSTMLSPTSMRVSGLAFRFQYQAGLSSRPLFEANTRYRSPSARYIMMLVRGFPLRAPTVCRSTIGAPSNGPLTRPWLARNSAILRSLKSLPSLIEISSHRLASSTGHVTGHPIVEPWPGNRHARPLIVDRLLACPSVIGLAGRAALDCCTEDDRLRKFVAGQRLSGMCDQFAGIGACVIGE